MTMGLKQVWPNAEVHGVELSAPFWNGFADTDVRQTLIEGGFLNTDVFADYVSIGGGREYFIFGAQK